MTKEEELKDAIKKLRHFDPQVRITGAEVLKRLKDPRAVEPLINALGGNAEVVLYVSQALGEIGDKRAVEPLIEAFQVSTWAHPEIAEALEKIGDPKGILFAEVFGHKKRERIPELANHVDTVIKLLGAERDYGYCPVGDMAADALTEIGDEKGTLFVDVFYYGKKERISELGMHIDTVTEFLHVRERKVRERAADVLAKIGDHRATEPLLRMLKYCFTRERGMVARALAKLGDPRALEALMEDTERAERSVGAATSSDFLRKMQDDAMCKISNVEDEHHKNQLLNLIEKISERRNELLEPDAKKLKPPKRTRRKKPKRRMWRIAQ